MYILKLPKERPGLISAESSSRAILHVVLNTIGYRSSATLSPRRRRTSYLGKGRSKVMRTKSPSDTGPQPFLIPYPFNVALATTN